MSEDKFYIEEEDGWIYLKLENYPYTLFTQKFYSNHDYPKEPWRYHYKTEL